MASRNEKRELILSAARQIFAHRGVVDVTMEDIAKEAKVSKGALYLHFASKDELFLEVMAEGSRQLLTRVREASATGNGFEAFRAMLLAFSDFSIEDLTRFRLAAAWLVPGCHIDYTIAQAQEYRDSSIAVMRAAVETFLKGQRDGSIRSDLDATMTVHQCWGSLQGLIILRAKGLRSEAKPPQADPDVWGSLQTDPPTRFKFESVVPNFVEHLMELIAPRR